MERAVVDYDEAIRLDPSNVSGAFLNRSQAWAAKGDWDGALADAEAVIRLDPGNVGGFLNRSQARGAKGDWHGALADTEAVIRLEPGNAMAFNNRGWRERTPVTWKVRSRTTTKRYVSIPSNAARVW